MLTVSTDRGSVSVPVVVARDARRASCGCRPTALGVRCAATSPRAPARSSGSRPPRGCRMNPRRRSRARVTGRQGLRRRSVVARPRQGPRRLRLPRRHDPVRDLGRAPRRRPDAAAHRAQPGRAVRPAAEPRRRHQARAQGRHHPQGGRPGGVRPGADRLGDGGVPGVRGHPVRPGGHDLRPHARAAAHRPPGRGALHPRGRLGGHLRHRARRLVERLDLPAAGWPALVGPDDLLRGRDGAVVRRRSSSTPARCRRRRSSTHRRSSGTPSCSSRPS